MNEIAETSHDINEQALNENYANMQIDSFFDAHVVNFGSDLSSFI